MKTNHSGPGAIALFLAALVLFQSCVVYHKTPTTLEQASRERVQTKVTGKNGMVHKFKYLAREDGTFYGMNEKSGEWVKTPLAQEELARVQTKDKSGSTWATVALIAVPVIALVIIGTTLDIGPGNTYPFEEL